MLENTDAELQEQGERAVLLYLFSWTRGQESFFFFFMISGDTIEIGIRETSQTRGGKRELCDF